MWEVSGSLMSEQLHVLQPRSWALVELPHFERLKLHNGDGTSYFDGVNFQALSRVRAHLLLMVFTTDAVPTIGQGRSRECHVGRYMGLARGRIFSEPFLCPFSTLFLRRLTVSLPSQWRQQHNPPQCRLTNFHTHRANSQSCGQAMANTSSKTPWAR